jgi:hypothetical protein
MQVRDQDPKSSSQETGLVSVKGRGFTAEDAEEILNLRGRRDSCKRGIFTMEDTEEIFNPGGRAVSLEAIFSPQRHREHRERLNQGETPKPVIASPVSFSGRGNLDHRDRFRLR